MHGDMIYLDRKYLPLISEALALCKALTWLKEHGIHHIIVEYDALQLVFSVNNNRIESSYLGLLFKI